VIGYAAFVIGIAIAMAGHPPAARASDSHGARAASDHCAQCHAMPGEIDTGLATALDEISTTQRIWTDIDLRTALPRLHGAKAAIAITSEEAREIGAYLQSIQSGHSEFFP
jgi:mono/diheme cytochrome c family protein